jgi:hypothetical protein
MWAIGLRGNVNAFWSNHYGWVDWEGDFDLFTKEERQTLRLPINGKWVYLEGLGETTDNTEENVTLTDGGNTP